MKPEILAPAGDFERLKIALLYGADAVYIGGSLFGLRANAINFSIEEIKEAVLYTHSLNKKLYVTVNIVMHNKEADKILNYLKELELCNIDAIIVSDLSIVKMALENTNLEVHISTQQSTLNYEAVEFLKKLGATRVVLGRETSKEDIELIKQKVDIELECFIHGAMCASYSGRCVLSNYLTNRDANRGGCSQICRWDFDLEGEEKIEGDKNFTFCTKDLSLLKHIPDMIDIGVDSLKIEGRMRSIYYIATVVSIYRKVVDSYYNNKNIEYNNLYESILNRVANRDSCVQFFDGNFGSDTNYYNNRIEVSNQDFLGVVKEVCDDYIILEQRNYFKKGDFVEFFGPDHTISYQINEIYDENDDLIEIVRHPKQIVKLPITFKLNENDFMRIKVDK